MTVFESISFVVQSSWMFLLMSSPTAIKTTLNTLWLVRKTDTHADLFLQMSS